MAKIRTLDSVLWSKCHGVGATELDLSEASDKRIVSFKKPLFQPPLNWLDTGGIPEFKFQLTRVLPLDA